MDFYHRLVQFKSGLGFRLGLSREQCLFGADVREDHLHDGTEEPINRKQIGEDDILDSLGRKFAIEDRHRCAKADFAVVEIELEAAMAEAEVDAAQELGAS